MALPVTGSTTKSGPYLGKGRLVIAAEDRDQGWNLDSASRLSDLKDTQFSFSYQSGKGLNHDSLQQIFTPPELAELLNSYNSGRFKKRERTLREGVIGDDDLSAFSINQAFYGGRAYITVSLEDEDTRRYRYMPIGFSTPSGTFWGSFWVTNSLLLEQQAEVELSNQSFLVGNELVAELPKKLTKEQRVGNGFMGFTDHGNLKTTGTNARWDIGDSEIFARSLKPIHISCSKPELNPLFDLKNISISQKGQIDLGTIKIGSEELVLKLNLLEFERDYGDELKVYLSVETINGAKINTDLTGIPVGIKDPRNEFITWATLKPSSDVGNKYFAFLDVPRAGSACKKQILIGDLVFNELNENFFINGLDASHSCH